MFPVLIVVLVLLVYAWIVYPAVVLLVGRRASRQWAVGPPQADAPVAHSGQKEEGKMPHVAILFSAHNEESVILKRLENLAALDYPAERLHVFVGVDGGSDRTAEIALEWARTHPLPLQGGDPEKAKSHPQVHVIVSPENHGKTAMLKRLVREGGGRSVEDTLTLTLSPEGRGNSASSSPFRGEDRGEGVKWTEILTFTDANTMFAPDAMRQLVAPFADPKVGGVCGQLVFLDSTGAETRENLYWRTETLLKTAESRLDSCLGANGAIYAIRPELFWDGIPESTIIDDFVIGMKVRERGFQMIYEPQALAYEPTPARIADEWRRRVRIGAGAFQAMAYCRACLAPRYGRFALFFWSHKILRWFTPHLMVLLAVVATVNLIYGSAYSRAGAAVILVAGVGFAALAVLGRIMGPSSPLKAFEYFLSMQVALFVGFLRYCRGGLKGTWERTERGG